MAFWLIAALMALVVVSVLAFALLRPGRAAGVASAAFDMQVYRDQLGELDRDLARGTIGKDEAERARLEISRRLLEADKAAREGGGASRAPRSLTLSALALSAALILGGGFWLYLGQGAVSSDWEIYPDMPLKTRIALAAETRTTRPSQAEAEALIPEGHQAAVDAPADYLALVEQLRAAVAERPDDLEGQTLLTNHEARLGNFPAAYAAKQRVIAIKGDAATAQDYAQLADLMVIGAGGYVSPEAEAALARAMELDHTNGIARYYSGLMFAQIGRPDIAFRFWRDLLEESPPDALWVPPIREQILQVAAMAGVDYALPAPAGVAGPTAEDMDAAADMSAEDRGAMIAAMVEQLSTRLATEGGTAPEWAQLIRALAVLGQTERAAAIWDEARQVFAAIPDELAIVRQAAAEAGVEHMALPDLPPVPAPAPTPAPEAQAETTAEMVLRLADKLGRQGGTAPEWAQLIEGAASLGETDWANAMWQEAKQTFAARPDQLAIIREAAVRAGLPE
jgi:cytochrome c-type biogenesis protein CcmH